MADATPENPAPPSAPKRRVRQLETLSDVRRALAQTCKRLERASKDPEAKGAMSVDHARALVYAYSKLAELIRAGVHDEVLDRLRELEQRQAAVDEERRVQ